MQTLSAATVASKSARTVASTKTPSFGSLQATSCQAGGIRSREWYKRTSMSSAFSRLSVLRMRLIS